jgi:hypothetical protein
MAKKQQQQKTHAYCYFFFRFFSSRNISVVGCLIDKRVNGYYFMHSFLYPLLGKARIVRFFAK